MYILLQSYDDFTTLTPNILTWIPPPALKTYSLCRRYLLTPPLPRLLSLYPTTLISLNKCKSYEPWLPTKIKEKGDGRKSRKRYLERDLMWNTSDKDNSSKYMEFWTFYLIKVFIFSFSEKVFLFLIWVSVKFPKYAPLDTSIKESSNFAQCKIIYLSR